MGNLRLSSVVQNERNIDKQGLGLPNHAAGGPVRGRALDLSREQVSKPSGAAAGKGFNRAQEWARAPSHSVECAELDWVCMQLQEATSAPLPAARRRRHWERCMQSTALDPWTFAASWGRKGRSKTRSWRHLSSRSSATRCVCMCMCVRVWVHLEVNVGGGRGGACARVSEAIYRMA